MSEPRVAVITGGTGALGRALLPRLLARGYRVGITYIVPEEAADLEDGLHGAGDAVLLRRVDATDPVAITEFMDEVAGAFGGVHVVCALVGGWAGGRDVEETDDTRFDRMIDLNLRSAFVTARAAIPHLRKSSWGRIVLVGSTAAYEAPAGQAAYNIAKAGVVALARSLAQELRDANITANAVMPSVIDTPATRAAMPYADFVDWPGPEEIAAVIDFLASEESGVINGAAIPVAGRS